MLVLECALFFVLSFFFTDVTSFSFLLEFCDVKSFSFLINIFSVRRFFKVYDLCHTIYLLSIFVGPLHFFKLFSTNPFSVSFILENNIVSDFIFKIATNIKLDNYKGIIKIYGMKSIVCSFHCSSSVFISTLIQ